MTAGDRPRLPPKGRPREPARGTATGLALIGLIFIFGGLLALMMMVLPAELRIVVLVVGLTVSFFGGHYLLWGRWLDRILPRDEDQGPVEFWRRAEPPDRPREPED